MKKIISIHIMISLLLTLLLTLPVSSTVNQAYALTVVEGTYPSAVIEIAKAEVGYHEKKTNSQLYDKTANSGNNNWNKYAADIDKNYPNFYNGKKNIGGDCGWCDIFVDWCFIQAYGYDNALKLLCQPTKSCGAGPKYSMNYYKKKGQFGTTPKLGAQIFVSNAGHTGLVYKFDSTYVYTIEGNWDDSVKYVKRKLSSSVITGYGYPGFSTSTTPSYTDNEIEITGAVYPEGSYGSLTHFGLRGVVSTSGYLVSVEGALYNLSTLNNDYYKKVTFSNTTTKSHDIQGEINDALIFGGLTGYYEYQVIATYVIDNETKTSVLIDSFFTIGSFNLITSLAVSPTSLIINVSDSYQIDPSFEPSNASKTTFNWESTDPSIVTVSDDGLVTAVSPGAADIYCKTTDGTNIITACHISVPGKCGDNLTWGYSNSTLTISGTGAMYWYDYAPWYNLHDSIRYINISNDVTELGSYAFYDCYNVQSITLPQSLAHVGTGTFASCTSLKEITIPASMILINTEAFINCSGLTKVTFPETLESIGWGAFLGCTSLESLTIPENVYDIQPDAFKNCSSLKSAMIPSTVYVIGDSTFENCPNLTIYCDYGSNAYYHAIENNIPYVLTSGTCGDNAYWNYSNGILTIGGTGSMTDFPADTDQPWYNFRTSIQSIYLSTEITRIGNHAFEGFSALTHIDMPCVTSIGTHAFRICSNIEYFNIPETCTNIGAQAFDGCYKLQYCNLPGSLKIISTRMFHNCHLMTSYEIPEGATTIQKWAFLNNNGLEKITIPSSVVTIADDAFEGCDNYTIYCAEGSYAHTYAQNNEIPFKLIGGNCGDNVTWYYNNGTLTVSGTGEMTDFIRGEQPWIEFIASIQTINVMEGVTTIGDYAFDNDQIGTSFTTVTLPDSLTRIGKLAFYYANMLTNINIPDGISVIGANAFRRCYRITEFSIPSSLTIIPEGLFWHCDALTNLEIPGSVTSIGSGAFQYCASLEEITIPASVTSINANAFEGTDNVTITCYAGSTAHIFAKTQELNYTLLSYPLSGFDFKLPSALTTIEEEAFAGISAKRVRLAEGVTKIGNSAFANCPNLVCVYIPDGCTSIATNAFSSVSNLTIYGHDGSYAEFFAGKYGYEFIVIDSH